MVDNDNVLVRSAFIQQIENDGVFVIWHSLFGYPKIVSSATLEFLNYFLEPKTLLSWYDTHETNAGQEAIDELVRCYFLKPKTLDERKLLVETMQRRKIDITNGSLVEYLELIMCESCNFRCTYCIHFNNLEISDRINSPKKFMSFHLAKKTVDKYLDILKIHNKHVAEINFGGGEPLLNWQVIKQIIEYCDEAYSGTFDIHFSINTNASLMTKEIAETLKQYNVDIASSLDGLQKGNDSVRMTKSGRGTYGEITDGFQTLKRVGYPLNGIAVTITENNFHELNESLIDWAVTHGMTNVRIDIDVIGMVSIPIYEIISKLMNMRRYGKRLGVDVPGFWSRPAENLSDSPLDKRVTFCGAIEGNSICVAPSGKIYSCGYSVDQIGDIATIQSFYSFGSPYYKLVEDHLTGVMEMCKGCMIEGHCGGGCKITHEFAKATGTTKIERMCNFYRDITKEILKDQLLEASIEVTLPQSI